MNADLVARIEAYFSTANYGSLIKTTQLLREALAALKELEIRETKPYVCPNCLERVEIQSAHLVFGGEHRFSCKPTMPWDSSHD